jgi:hypothetical protein
MKALSIKQPWASLIAHGIKDIENRTWKTNFRGRIFIHVSGLSASSTFQLLNHLQNLKLIDYQHELDEYINTDLKSAIIGEVDIIDCVVNHPSIWAEKSKETLIEPNVSVVMKSDAIYNWVLANPILYDKPILNIKGKPSFWDYK